MGEEPIRLGPILGHVVRGGTVLIMDARLNECQIILTILWFSSSSSSSTLRLATWWTSWSLERATTGQIPCGRDCNYWGTSISIYLKIFTHLWKYFIRAKSIIRKNQGWGYQDDRRVWNRQLLTNYPVMIINFKDSDDVDNWDAMVMVMAMMMAWMTRTSKTWTIFVLPDTGQVLPRRSAGSRRDNGTRTGWAESWQTLAPREYEKLVIFIILGWFFVFFMPL